MLKNDLPIDFVSQWFQHNRMNVVDKEIKNGNIIRIHIPIRTSINVHFYLWEGKEQNHYNLQTGKYYYTDVSKPHAVHNKWDEDRLHLEVDCYNNEKLENLLHIDNTEKK